MRPIGSPGRPQPGLDLSQTTMSRQGGPVPLKSPHPGDLVTYAENYAENYPQRNTSVANRSQVSAPSISDLGESIPPSEPTDDERSGSRQSYTRVGTSYGQGAMGTQDGIPEEEEYRGAYERRQEQPAPVLPPIAPVAPIDFRSRSESRTESRQGEGEGEREQGQEQMGIVGEPQKVQEEGGQLQEEETPEQQHQTPDISHHSTPAPSQYERERIPRTAKSQRSHHESEVSSLHSRSTPQPEQQMSRMGAYGSERNQSITSQTLPSIQQSTQSLASTMPTQIDQGSRRGHSRSASDVGEAGFGMGHQYPPQQQQQQHQWQGPGNVGQGGYGQQQQQDPRQALGHGGYQSPAAQSSHSSRQSPAVEYRQPGVVPPSSQQGFHEQGQQMRGHARSESASSFGTHPSQPSITALRENSQGSPHMRNGSISSLQSQQLAQQQLGGNLTTVNSRTEVTQLNPPVVSPPQSQHSGSIHAPSLPNSPMVPGHSPQLLQSGFGSQPPQGQSFPSPARAVSPVPFRGPFGVRPQSPAIGGPQDAGDKKPHPLAHSFAPGKREKGEGRRVSSFLGGVLGAKSKEKDDKRKFSLKDVGNMVRIRYIY